MRSRHLENYRLDEDPRLISECRRLSELQRSKIKTPAGDVEYMAVPLMEGDLVSGVFVVAQFRNLQQQPIDAAIVATGAVGLAVLLIGSLLAWMVAERVLLPVRSMTQTAQTISESDLTQRLAMHGHDELADLARTFNALLDRLELAFASQRRLLDDARIASFLAKGLRAHGYATEVAVTGGEGLALAHTGDFALVILDIGLPDRDGFSVLAELRAHDRRLPVLILTARDDVTDAVAGFDGGGSDYVTKPFRFDELLARIRARMRDSDQALKATLLRVEVVTLDLRTRRACVGDRTIDLSAR